MVNWWFAILGVPLGSPTKTIPFIRGSQESKPPGPKPPILADVTGNWNITISRLYEVRWWYYFRNTKKCKWLGEFLKWDALKVIRIQDTYEPTLSNMKQRGFYVLYRWWVLVSLLWGAGSKVGYQNHLQLRCASFWRVNSLTCPWFRYGAPDHRTGVVFVYSVCW